MLERQQSDELPGGSYDPGRDSQDASQDPPHAAPEQTNGPVSGQDHDTPATVLAEGASQGGQEMLPNGVLNDGKGVTPQTFNEGKQQMGLGQAAGGADVLTTSGRGAQHGTAMHAGQSAEGVRPEQGGSGGAEALPDGHAAMEESKSTAIAPSDAQPTER